MIDSLIKNSATTDTFSEEGTQMKMILALKEIIKSDDNIYRQPMIAAKRILKFCKLYHPETSIVCEPGTPLV